MLQNTHEALIELDHLFNSLLDSIIERDILSQIPPVYVDHQLTLLYSHGCCQPSTHNQCFRPDTQQPVRPLPILPSVKANSFHTPSMPGSQLSRATLQKPQQSKQQQVLPATSTLNKTRSASYFVSRKVVLPHITQSKLIKPV